MWGSTTPLGKEWVVFHCTQAGCIMLDTLLPLFKNQLWFEEMHLPLDLKHHIAFPGTPAVL
jgi:hypothetical protein